MTLKQLLKAAEKKLRPKKITCPADKNVGWLEAELLMAHTLKKPKEWVVTHETDTLSPTLGRAFTKLVTRRQKHEPIAYIIGFQPFYGRSFAVNEHTLIPRPESELMIDIMRERAHGQFLFWDVGTGSGAIGITLALEFPSSQVIATDVSNKALKIAEKNAATYQVQDRFTAMHADLLEKNVVDAVSGSHLPLMIAANLPYLPLSDKKKLAPDVVKFEPVSALFAGKDGNELIKTFLTQVSEAPNINPEMLLLEFDPPNANKLELLALELFPQGTITIHHDLSGRQRLLEIDLRP